MPTIVDRDRVVALLRAEFEAIIAMCRGFDDVAWRTPTCLPGWSVKDQVSHLLGTESMLDDVPAPDVDVSHLDHVRNDIGAFNELWVEYYRPQRGDEVLAAFEQVTKRRIASLEAMTQADFDAPTDTPVGPESYGRFMRIRLFDLYLHEHDVRDALGLDGRPDHEHLSVVLDEVAAALGYVVGRRAAMPSGSAVRITVTGGVDRSFDLEVGERAALVDGLSSDPDVEIRLPALLLLRLVGGRTDPAPHVATDVALEGDAELARRLASNLAYTV